MMKSPASNIKTLDVADYKQLNNSQIDIIYAVLTSQNKITCIQGPPGTGKSTLLIGLIKQIHKLDNNPDILVLAPSNNAIDEVTYRLMGTGLKVVRIGHSNQERIKEVTLEEKAHKFSRNNEEVNNIKKRIEDKEINLAKHKKAKD